MDETALSEKHLRILDAMSYDEYRSVSYIAAKSGTEYYKTLFALDHLCELHLAVRTKPKSTTLYKRVRIEVKGG